MEGKRILIDTSKCVACKACQVACQQWHSLPSEDTTFTGTYQNPPDMSGANLTVAKFFEIFDTKLKWLFFKDQCRHCNYPNCKLACPLTPKQSKGIKMESSGLIQTSAIPHYVPRRISNHVRWLVPLKQNIRLPH